LKNFIYKNKNNNNSFINKEKDYIYLLQVEKNKKMYEHQYKDLVHSIKSECYLILFNILIINNILLLIDFISNSYSHKNLIYFAIHSIYYLKISNWFNFVIQFVKIILNISIQYVIIKLLWKFSNFDQILYIEKRYWMKKYEQNIKNKTFGLALQNQNHNSNIDSNSTLLYNKYKPKVRVNIIIIVINKIKIYHILIIVFLINNH